MSTTHLPEVRQWESTDSSLRIRITDEAFESIVGYCVQANVLETGGILAGRTGQEALITAVTGPPDDSVHRTTTFDRGTAGLDEWLAQGREHDGTNYLGEWHFHPRASPDISPIDERAMHEIATDEDYDCPNPVCLVVGGHVTTGFTTTVGIGDPENDFERFQEAPQS